jgi:hypothetical protein
LENLSRVQPTRTQSGRPSDAHSIGSGQASDNLTQPGSHKPKPGGLGMVSFQLTRPPLAATCFYPAHVRHSSGTRPASVRLSSGLRPASVRSQFVSFKPQWSRNGGRFSSLTERRLHLHDLNEVAYGHGCRGRGMLRSSGSPVQSGISLAESHRPSCKSLIPKAADSSSIAGRIGHILQVAPTESAATRVFIGCARASTRGTPDRALTTSRAKLNLRRSRRVAP